MRNARNPLNQPLAALQHIAVGALEITRVPGVGDIARVVGKIKQSVDFAVKLLGGNSLEIADIRGVHADNEVKFLEIGAGYLPSALFRVIYPKSAQNRGSPVMHAVSDFLG